MIDYITSGPIFVLILQREDAVGKLRELIGATDPEEAAEGTIRRHFATSIEKNVIYGSDSLATARFEIGFFIEQGLL